MKVLTNTFFDILKKVFHYFHNKMDPNFLNNFIHDQVIRASASTYNLNELQRRGWKITANTSNQKVQYIGSPPNHIFPEVVIWQPDNPYATSGRAVIVEAVETSDTINTLSIDKWRRFASINIPFNLVIPEAEEQRVRTMLTQANIPNVNVQTYVFDPNQQRYIFNRIRR